MTKKKKKKRRKLPIPIIISGIIGATMGFFIIPIRNYLEKMERFIIPPFYIVILIIILSFILAVALHEFGHAISFVRNKIKMRAIIFMNFMFIKEEKKWKFKIISNKSLGGVAVPEIQGIKDEEDFLLKQKGFANAIIAGPIASLVSWTGLTIIGLIIINMTKSIYLSSIIWVFIIILGLITILLLASSFLKNDMVVGDFPAYKITKDDNYFAAVQLYNYGYFSNNPKKAREENIYLRDLIIKELTEKYKRRDTHWYTISMVDTILVEYLVGFLDELPRVVEDYINYILERPNILLDLRTNQAKEIVYFHLIRYLYINEESRNKSFELYEDIKDTIKPNTPKRKYLFKQIEDVLGIKNNREYLMNEKNIVNTDMHFIYKHFHGFLMDEIKLNELG